MAAQDISLSLMQAFSNLPKTGRDNKAKGLAGLFGNERFLSLLAALGRTLTKNRPDLPGTMLADAFEAAQQSRATQEALQTGKIPEGLPPDLQLQIQQLITQRMLTEPRIQLLEAQAQQAQQSAEASKVLTPERARLFSAQTEKLQSEPTFEERVKAQLQNTLAAQATRREVLTTLPDGTQAPPGEAFVVEAGPQGDFGKVIGRVSLQALGRGGTGTSKDPRINASLRSQLSGLILNVLRPELERGIRAKLGKDAPINELFSSFRDKESGGLNIDRILGFLDATGPETFRAGRPEMNKFLEMMNEAENMFIEGGTVSQAALREFRKRLKEKGQVGAQTGTQSGALPPLILR